MSIHIGETLEKRYKIDRKLGQGGFGAVYHAMDLRLNIACAIKESLDVSESVTRQFEREASILAELRHPNLPRVTDYFNLQGNGLFLVMDFIEGEDLAAKIYKNGSGLTIEQVLPWIKQICAALDYLHNHNPPIIHRDIKPQNIIVTKQNTAVLVDFGLAKAYDPLNQTTTGARGGTSGFSPLEQYGQGTTDPRSDIYSLAATIYVLLTGKVPPDSIQRVINNVPLQEIQILNKSIRAPLANIIMKALEIEPTKRIQTIKVFLNSILENQKGKEYSHMPSHSKSWYIMGPVSPQVNEALAAFSPITRQLLYNRGFTTNAKAFAYLRAEVDFDPSPFQMTGIPATMERVHFALDHHEPIAIYGNYDVDGVAATALLVQALRALGGNVQGYIPNRFDEGYGLNNKAISALHAQGIKLVITVDCGIRSPIEAAYARAIGLDLIITDRYLPAEGNLPPAVAVVNPKQAGDKYPDKDLAAVGVAYKIVQALMKSIRLKPEKFQEDDLLELVALGTVGGNAPLVGENRILVRKGIEQIRKTKQMGIFSLAMLTDLPLNRITSTTIRSTLVPRLEAPGRLESALPAFEILITTNIKTAAELAQQINYLHRQKQALTQKIQVEADAIALALDPTAELFFAVHPDFNAGLIDLAAKFLVEKYNRPAVVGKVCSETTMCFCCSIPEFHIIRALDQCQDLLVNYSGNWLAVRFTVRNENIEILKKRLKSLMAENFRGLDLRQTIIADMELALSSLNLDLLKQLEYLEPTGYGNPDAVFVTRRVKVHNPRVVGGERNDLKIKVSDGINEFDAIGDHLGYLQQDLPNLVDIIYSLEVDESTGRKIIRLKLKDIKPP